MKNMGMALRFQGMDWESVYTVLLQAKTKKTVHM